MVYVRTADDNDALAWVDEEGRTVTESKHEILRAAACEPSPLPCLSWLTIMLWWRKPSPVSKRNKAPRAGKRFNIGGTTRDKLYDLTQGTEGSRVEYLAVSPAGACETIRVNLKPGNGARKLDFEFDFSTLAVKNRHAQGNVLTKYPIQKISLTKL